MWLVNGGEVGLTGFKLFRSFMSGFILVCVVNSRMCTLPDAMCINHKVKRLVLNHS